jgi:MGT family glycosyltransferase
MQRSAPSIGVHRSVFAARPTHFNPPDWWSDLETFKPVIHVTQGTVATRSSELLVPTLQALADEDVLVIATTGGKSLESLGLARLPANARVAPFIPYAKLLPRVDVMITNGGYGGVQAALAHGIPLVVAGATEDKPEIARRVAWSGVGIDLRTGTPTAREVRAAAQTLLNDSRYRQRARCLQKVISAYDAPRRAAEVIERLISG